MERLPIELVQLICTFMSQKDLGAFRLVSRLCAESGAMCMFENLHLMILLKSFENLSNIASRPSLSRYVKKITYEALTLELLEKDEWRERLPIVPGAPPMPEYPGYPLTPRERRHYTREVKIWDQQYGPGSQFTHNELEQAWLSYRAILDSTDEIQIFCTDFATMNVTFRAFPQLKVIEFQTDKEPSETMKDAFASTLISPSPIGGDEQDFSTTLNQRYLAHLLLALSHTDVKLTSFKGETIPWQAFRVPADTFHYTSSRVSPSVEFPWKLDPTDVASVFSNLRQLYLVFEPQFAPHDNLLGDQEDVGKVLQSAKLLRVLRLYIMDPFYSSNFVFLRNICGDDHWPFLEVLELSSVRVAENDLVDLMKRHSRTLKTLKLGSMYLFEGQWASAFQRMRTVLRLNEVGFHGVFINDNDGEDDEEEENEDDDIYLEMHAPLHRSFNSLPLGSRLETYFLGENYRCPLRTRAQKEKLRTEAERLREIFKGNGDFAEQRFHLQIECIENDGLLSC